MSYVVRIDNEFRDSLFETLDKNDHTGKVRPYYYGVLMEITSFSSRCAVTVQEAIASKFIIPGTE